MIFVDQNHVLYNGCATDASSTAQTMTPEIISSDNQLFYAFLGGIRYDDKEDASTQRIVMVNKYGVWFFAKIVWEQRRIHSRAVAPKNKVFFLADNEGETSLIKAALINTALEHHGWTLEQAHHEIGKFAPGFVSRCYAIKDLVTKLKTLTDDDVNYAFD